MTSNVLPAEDRIERYARELVVYVRLLFPMRFYGGEKWWTVYTAAALLRLTDMAEAVLVHLPPRRDLDAAAALRSMYELAVTLTWVLIDPERRTELWQGEARLQELKLHNDLAAFGETLLSSTEVAAAETAVGLPALADRATEVDKHWSSQIDGLHAPGHLLAFRGLYNGIYRRGSRPVHGSIASLSPYIGQEATRFVVAPAGSPATTLDYALVSPLLAMTLVVVSSKVRWIDASKVREINDQACATGPITDGDRERHRSEGAIT